MTKKSFLEAILFLTGKAMTERQLSDMTGVSLTSVKRLLSKLRREYEDRDSGLKVARRGRRWVLQVREEYMAEAAGIAPATLPQGVLKTAGLIAYYQPVRQSHLAHLVGPKVYKHVKGLRERGLIAAKPLARTLLLTTTSKFLEFFGVEARNREDLRRLLAERVGVRVDDTQSSSGLIIST